MWVELPFSPSWAGEGAWLWEGRRPGEVLGPVDRDGGLSIVPRDKPETNLEYLET